MILTKNDVFYLLHIFLLVNQLKYHTKTMLIALLEGTIGVSRFSVSGVFYFAVFGFRGPYLAVFGFDKFRQFSYFLFFGFRPFYFAIGPSYY